MDFLQYTVFLPRVFAWYPAGTLKGSGSLASSAVSASALSWAWAALGVSLPIALSPVPASAVPARSAIKTASIVPRIVDSLVVPSTSRTRQRPPARLRFLRVHYPLSRRACALEDHLEFRRFTVAHARRA